jgi:phosphatidylinositol alpha-1,6-mannosyltransferase
MFHTHLSAARVQRFLGGRLSAPYAVFLHGIEVWDRLAPADRAILDGAALLVTNSAHTARRAEAANPGLGPVAVCPLGHSAPNDAPAARRHASPIILTVARMVSTERYKGHDQLIEALPAIRRRVPEARLVFVGAGDDVPRLRAKAHALDVAAHVTFTGFLPDEALRRSYAEAAVFAMPSRGEGFGLAYLEAMAAGVPCVGSVHDAASEVIEDGITGYLVRQENLDEIATRVSSLLLDPGLAAGMGRQGRERWAREFTYADFRRRLMAALDRPFRLHGAAATQPSRVAG